MRRPTITVSTLRSFSSSVDNKRHPLVLTSEYASLIAMEFNRNPIVNDEAAFDIYPPCVENFHLTESIAQ